MDKEKLEAFLTNKMGREVTVRTANPIIHKTISLAGEFKVLGWALICSDEIDGPLYGCLVPWGVGVVGDEDTEAA
jgi:hypothetical protein